MQRIELLRPAGQFGAALELAHEGEVVADIGQGLRVVRVEAERALGLRSNLSFSPRKKCTIASQQRA